MRRGLRDLLPRGHRNRISTKEKKSDQCSIPNKGAGTDNEVERRISMSVPRLLRQPLLGIELWSDSYFFSDSGTAPGVPGTEPPRLRKSRVPSARTKFLPTALLVPSFA